jgi:hypothetical protein
LRLVGKNFGESASTSVTIGGLKSGVSWWDLKDGVIDVWVPSEIYKKAGEYPVLVNTKYGTSNSLPLKIESTVMMIKPVTVTTKPSNKINTVKPPVNTSVNTVKLKNIDNASRLNLEMLRGVRVTMIGVIKDASLSAQLESYISGLENVFVVSNQLTFSDSPANINIQLKAVGVDAAAVDEIIKLINTKAASLSLSVIVNPLSP